MWFCDRGFCAFWWHTLPRPVPIGGIWTQFPFMVQLDNQAFCNDEVRTSRQRVVKHHESHSDKPMIHWPSGWGQHSGWLPSRDVAESRCHGGVQDEDMTVEWQCRPHQREERWSWLRCRRCCLLKLRENSHVSSLLHEGVLERGRRTRGLVRSCG